MTTSPPKLWDLAQDALIEMYELDATAIGGTVYRFTQSDMYGQPIIWQGNTYNPFPMFASGFERRANGALPRPTLQVSNQGGFMSAICKATGDLSGAKLTRIRTLKKYLDAACFPALDQLVRQSENFGDALWNGYVLKPTITTGITAPDGSATAIRMASADGGGNYSGLFMVADGTLPNGDYSVEVWGRATSGTLGVSFGVDDGLLTAATLTTTWQKLNTVKTKAAAFNNRIFEITESTAANVPWEIWHPMVNAGNVQLPYQQTVGATLVAARNPTANPNIELPREIWRIDRRSGETPEAVAFELAAPWDVAGIMLPRRIVVQNSCMWAYRSAECGYVGGPVATATDAATSNSALDSCGKRVSSCKLRFGATAELPFGGFPGVGQTSANS